MPRTFAGLWSGPRGMHSRILATTSGVIDHGGADVWLMAPNVTNFDAARPIAASKRHQALAVPGVVQAESLIVQFAVWRRPQGGTENVEIVGFDLGSGLGGPWNVTAGSVADLHGADTVLVDEVYRRKLGVEDALAELPHLSEQMLVTLGKANIRTLDDLADLATDELIQKKRVEPRRREPSNRPKDKGGVLAEYGLNEEQGNEIIMAARAHWFEDEAPASAAEEDAAADEAQ